MNQNTLDKMNDCLLAGLHNDKAKEAVNLSLGLMYKFYDSHGKKFEKEEIKIHSNIQQDFVDAGGVFTNRNFKNEILDLMMDDLHNNIFNKEM